METSLAEDGCLNMSHGNDNNNRDNGDKRNRANPSNRDRRVPNLSEQPLIEGEDYYLEGEVMVFTRAYHLRRGYCCKSSLTGCRHCPYRGTQS